MPKSELIKGDHPPFLLAPPHHIFWGEIKFPGRTLNLGNSRGALLFRVCRRRWRDLPLGRGAALGEVMGRQHCQPGQGCPLEMSRRSSAQENKPTSFMSPTDIKRPLPHCTQPPVRRREVCTSDWGQGPRGWGTPQGLGISERGLPTPPQGPRDVPLTGEHTQLGGSSHPPGQQGEAQCWVGHDPAASCNEAKGTQPPHVCFPSCLGRGSPLYGGRMLRGAPPS